MGVFSRKAIVAGVGLAFLVSSCGSSLDVSSVDTELGGHAVLGENASYSSSGEFVVAADIQDSELVVAIIDGDGIRDSGRVELEGVAGQTGVASDRSQNVWVVATTCVGHREEDVECPFGVVQVFRQLEDGPLREIDRFEGPGMYSDQIFALDGEAVVVVGDLVSGTRQAWVVGGPKGPLRVGPDLGGADVCVVDNALFLLGSEPNYEQNRNENYEISRIAMTSGEAREVVGVDLDNVFDQQMVCTEGAPLILAFARGRTDQYRIDVDAATRVATFGTLVPSGSTSQPYFLEMSADLQDGNVLVPGGQGELFEFSPSSVGAKSGVDRVEFVLSTDSSIIVGTRTDGEADISYVSK